MIQQKKVWRKIFNSFELGDRVEVVNQIWIFRNMQGTIVDKYWNGSEMRYLIKFNSKEFKRLDIYRTKDGMGKNCGGYFHFEDLKLL